MIKFRPPVLAATLSLIACSLPGQTLFEDKDETALTLSVDPASEGITLRQKETRFEVMSYATGLPPGYTDVIAKAQFKRHHNLSSEGEKSDLRVELYHFDSMSTKPVGKPVRTLVIPDASDAKFYNDSWEAITYGCCGAQNYNRLYSYTSEKPILRFNEKFWRIVVPNIDRERRYIGVLIKNHTNANAMEAAFGQRSDADFSVIYSDLKGNEQRAYFKLKKETGLQVGELKLTVSRANDTVEDQDQTATLWSADSTGRGNPPKNVDISGVTIIAELVDDEGKTETVQIPVEKDKLGKPKFNETNIIYLEPGK